MTPTTEIMRTLAWSLLHFLWQGAAIAAVAAAFMFVFRKPAARYLVGIAALALMLVSFGITFTLISGSSEVAAEVSAAGAPAAASLSTLGATANSMGTLMDEQAAFSSDGGFLWIARGWLAGVFVFALRIAFGLLVIELLRRRNLIALPEVLVERFHALQRRLGIRRAIRYAECHSLTVPAVVGFFRPMVLLPMRALTGLSPEQLEAVIAHELGHIKRFDVAVNFFQVIAESLFFFHPAVWWLNKRIRADREDCCDDVAIATCGGILGYARALATMESWRDVPHFAMAATGSPVAARVARLLGVRADNNGRAAGVVTASLVLATALIAGAVSLGVAPPVLAQGTGTSLEQLVAQANFAATGEAVALEPVVAPDPVAAPEPFAAPEPVVSPEPVTVAEPAPRPAAAPAPAVAPKPPREPKPASPATPAAPATPPTPPTSATHETSYIEEMNAEFETVDVDQLIELRVQDVTREYVHEIRSLGLKPDVNDVIALKVQGVTPQYVKEIRALGFNPSLNEIVAMKVQGVTPEYVKEMRAKGLNADADEIVAMKIHGVTPEYRLALEGIGLKLDISDLIEAKVMNITPEFARQAEAHGFKNLSLSKLIQLKIADVL